MVQWACSSSGLSPIAATMAGVRTNLAFHRAVLADSEFQAGGVDTGYLPRFLERAPSFAEA